MYLHKLTKWLAADMPAGPNRFNAFTNDDWCKMEAESQGKGYYVRYTKDEDTGINLCQVVRKCECKPIELTEDISEEDLLQINEAIRVYMLLEGAEEID